MVAEDVVFEFSEPNIVAWLSEAHCPNVLIQCSDGAGESIAEQIRASCTRPLHLCALPGPLVLPAVPQGSVVLCGVEGLSFIQQLVVNDWLTHRPGAHVVSVTSAPLPALVADGRFLEGLYYRLNVVRVDARERTKPTESGEG